MAEEREVAEKVERVMKVIDDEGAPPLAKEDWISMLEEIESQCASRREAAQEEIDNDNEDIF